MSKPLAIYTGYIVRYPLGGHVLAELHNIVGLQQVGYDVVYVEESGTGWAPCYDLARNEMTIEPSYGLGTLRDVLQPHGLEKSWCYVDSQRRYHGLSPDELRSLCRRSTVLFSRAGVNWLEEFRECKTRVFVDTDPGFTQFAMEPAPGPSCSGYASPLDFQFHFTFGERLGKTDCPVPLYGLNWQPTRQPIALELMPVQFTPNAQFYTTVMSWSPRKSIVYNGEEYGQKDIEFMKIIALPQRVGPIFEIALAGPNAPADKFTAAGWRLVNPMKVTASVAAYRDFIAQSRGEFSVAVNLEVKARTGWFSDRTASYLAAGKPVIVQDTGFSEFLPCGKGLFAFKTEDDVVDAVGNIDANYQKHCKAAHQIAEDYFDARKVLGELFRRCDLPVTG